MEMNRKFYNLDDVAQVLGLKVRTVRAWVVKGKIKGHKLASSNRWYVSSEELNRIIDEAMRDDDGNEG